MSKEEKLDDILTELRNTPKKFFYYSVLHAKFNELNIPIVDQDYYRRELVSSGVLLKNKNNDFMKGDAFHTYSGFVKQKEINNKLTENEIHRQFIKDKTSEWNYDTRKISLGISIISIIIALGFGVNSCENERSNKEEIRQLKFEVQSVKDSFSVYNQTRTQNRCLQ